MEIMSWKHIIYLVCRFIIQQSTQSKAVAFASERFLTKATSFSCLFLLLSFYYLLASSAKPIVGTVYRSTKKAYYYPRKFLLYSEEL